METLIGLTFAAAPFALTAVLLVLSERRQRRHETDVARQIALTDALHARVGAAVAPVVRRRGHVWHVTVAVPVDQPALVSAVLRTVDEVFGRATYQLHLTRRAPVVSIANAPRRARAAQESLSWT